jgi:hypothetical protein
MNQEAHELAGVLGSPFLSVSEGRGSSLFMYLPKRRKAPMPDSNELVAMLRAVIQEELKPVHHELEELKPVRQELQELKHGQERLENKVDKIELRQARLESKPSGNMSSQI